MAKWYRSLRVKLQLWHAIILLIVVIGFGGILDWQVARSHWDDVDEELLSAARIFEGAMRSVQRPVLDSMAQELGTPRPLPPPIHGGREEANRRRNPDAPRDRPPPQVDPLRMTRPRIGELIWEGPPSTGGTENEADWESQLTLPTSLTEQLSHGDSRAYFVIYRQDGSVLRQSDTLPNGIEVNESDLPLDIYPFVRRIQDRRRDVIIRGPHHTLICVGRDVSSEFERLHRFTLQLVALGCAIMIGGLMGGWWLGKRTVRPIEQMTSTAERITAESLHQRMNLDRVDVELEQLGSVLNGMLERLEGSFQVQTQFTADASHELRTPLAVVLSSCELALSKPRTSEEYREHFEKCRRAAVRMQRLTESLLALARLDAPARGELTSELTALDRVALECVDLMLETAGEHGVALSADIQPCEVHGNSAALAQVITNLIHNAIIYNRPGGTVKVKLAVEPGTAVLTVRDTGIGIAPEDLGRLFDRFYRADPARSRSIGGNGLGLAICKRIVELHGGEISVSSFSPASINMPVDMPMEESQEANEKREMEQSSSVGSVFTVRLPTS
ncbi:MAG: ATP-binding protein [Pirellulales bacterium]